MGPKLGGVCVASTEENAGLCQIYAEAATSFSQMCSPQQTGFKDDSWMLMSQHQRPCIGVEAQRKFLCWHLLFIWWTIRQGDALYMKPTTTMHWIEYTSSRASLSYWCDACARTDTKESMWDCARTNIHQPYESVFPISDLYNSIQKLMSLVPFLTRWEWGLFHGLLQCCRMANDVFKYAMNCSWSLIG